jgi:putative redox protein
MPDNDLAVTEGVEAEPTGMGRFQVEIRTGTATFVADEPVSVGGEGAGPTPYDLLGAALAACTTMTVKLYAERKGWPLTEVRVRVLHRREGLTARDRFAREIVLAGKLSDTQRRRLLEIANRCPVHQTLERGSDLVTVLAEAPLPGRLDPEPAEHMADMIKACDD